MGSVRWVRVPKDTTADEWNARFGVGVRIRLGEVSEGYTTGPAYPPEPGVKDSVHGVPATIIGRYGDREIRSYWTWAHEASEFSVAVPLGAPDPFTNIRAYWELIPLGLNVDEWNERYPIGTWFRWRDSDPWMATSPAVDGRLGCLVVDGWDMLPEMYVDIVSAQIARDVRDAKRTEPPYCDCTTLPPAPAHAKATTPVNESLCPRCDKQSTGTLDGLPWCDGPDCGAAHPFLRPVPVVKCHEVTNCPIVDGHRDFGDQYSPEQATRLRYTDGTKTPWHPVSTIGGEP